jgi:predicted transcriptional regulator
MKRKIGTIVDDDLYRQVKLLAVHERRRIADIVQHALSDYVKRGKEVRHGKAGLARLLEREPLKVTDKQLREVMEMDFFDQ